MQEKTLALMVGPDYKAWDLGLDCKFLLILHYFIPPLQFTVNIFFYFVVTAISIKLAGDVDLLT